MKRTIIPIELEPLTPDGGSVDVEVMDPGNLVDVLLQPKKLDVVPASLLTHLKSPNEPVHILVPIMMFEIDPDSQVKRKRSFAFIKAMKIIESENEVKHRTRLHYPDGRVFFVYEEILPEQEAVVASDLTPIKLEPK